MRWVEQIHVECGASVKKIVDYEAAGRPFPSDTEIALNDAIRAYDNISTHEYLDSLVDLLHPNDY
jgi:hypothetical protein